MVFKWSTKSLKRFLIKQQNENFHFQCHAQATSRKKWRSHRKKRWKSSNLIYMPTKCSLSRADTISSPSPGSWQRKSSRSGPVEVLSDSMVKLHFINRQARCKSTAAAYWKGARVQEYEVASARDARAIEKCGSAVRQAYLSYENRQTTREPLISFG